MIIMIIMIIIIIVVVGEREKMYTTKQNNMKS